MVFPGVQKSTWTHDSVAKAWYFHRFYDFQPDLNTSNPYVQAEILKIMGFWLQLGVSGFRMDAVPFVIAKKGAEHRRPVEQYDMLRGFREFLQWREGDAIILAEANVLPKTDMQYFGDDGDRMHMMFNFQVNQNLFYALAAADCRPVDQGPGSNRALGRPPLSGATFYATTMSSILVACPPDNAQQSSLPSAPRRTCSFMTAESDGGWRRCCKAIAAGLSWPTA